MGPSPITTNGALKLLIELASFWISWVLAVRTLISETTWSADRLAAVTAMKKKVARPKIIARELKSMAAVEYAIGSS